MCENDIQEIDKIFFSTDTTCFTAIDYVLLVSKYYRISGIACIGSTFSCMEVVDNVYQSKYDQLLCWLQRQ